MHKSVKDFFVDSGEKERVVGWSSDNGDIIAKGPFYILNENLKLKFRKKQTAVRFLVEVIRFWKDKRGFFCHDNTWKLQGEGKKSKRVDLPEDEWTFSYKTPSDCGGCVSGQKILDKIFGDRYIFNNLPCVTFKGDRVYSFRFELLKHFAKNGHESTVSLIEERKQEAKRLEAEAEAEEKKKRCEEKQSKLAKSLGATVISDELCKQLVPYAEEHSLIIVNQDVAAVITEGRRYGAGIGYIDQVRVFYKAQALMQEFQWRDQDSERNDKPWLKVNKLGKIKISEEDKKMVVVVELINNNSTRTATFTFDIS